MCPFPSVLRRTGVSRRGVGAGPRVRGCTAGDPRARTYTAMGTAPPPPGIGPVSLFADIHDQPQGKFLEGGAFDDAGNFWFVAIGSGWVSYQRRKVSWFPASTAIPRQSSGSSVSRKARVGTTASCNLTTRHLGIMVYDPQTKKLSSLVSTYRNQLFKGPNDLDFDAEGNLYFTDPWGTGPGPDSPDEAGAVYQYSTEGILRRVISTGQFPNGIAVSPNDSSWP